ncbi:MAG: hypothetical protein AAB415_02715, partial [Patescibacteria group bacterium]
MRFPAAILLFSMMVIPLTPVLESLPLTPAPAAKMESINSGGRQVSTPPKELPPATTKFQKNPKLSKPDQLAAVR